MKTPTHPSPSSVMLTHLILYLIPSLLRFLSLVGAGAPPYTPTEYILLNCGESTNTTSPDGRNWEGDAMSKFSPSDLQKTSSSSTASEQHPSVTQVPYMTARLFHSRFTYTFPVSPGPKFLRLYFYPATYSGFNISTSFFSIVANSHTLLKNFSASLTVSAIQLQQHIPVYSFIKEFCINVENNQRLNITISPSPSSFAFVNGIEIVSMPYNLYMGHTDDNPIKLVLQTDYSKFYNGNDVFTLENNTAFETLYRLNVGGEDVSVNYDTGMSRSWSDDLAYIYGQASGTTPHRSNATIHYTADTPAYTAPEIVYTTSRTMGTIPEVNKRNNLTWIFRVDSGFSYFVRLHFCETQLEVTRPNQRVFDIYINNQTAQKEMDVIQFSGGTGKPVYGDFVVLVPDQDGSRSNRDLWLALHPSTDLPQSYTDVILNGLEIFKLNQSDGSLAGPNPDPITVDPTSSEHHPKLPEKSKSKGSLTVIVATGAVLGVIAAISLLCFLIYRRRKRVKYFDTTTEAKSSWAPFSFTTKSIKTRSISLPSDLCRHFSIVDLKSATSNFHDNFIIGSGGFGNVYKGYIDDGSTTVAIKRLNPSSKQGAREFQTEIETLSQLRHLHLVSLIGYCDDEGEMILVYDYMARGTLRDHLYNTKNPPLPWKKRIESCIGAARGLHYLHTGAKDSIIHRDVKSTNILLDENWVAKVSDFGLSKVNPTDTSQTHVSTAVKGSIGYVDPEYYRRRQLTQKSDVYSFGVVLFEVLCGRPAIIPGLPKEQVNLAEWGRNCYQKGILDQIMDPNLKGKIAPECLRKFGEIADSCVRNHGMERPVMGDVVWTLEFALQLQENAEKIKEGGDGAAVNHILMNSVLTRMSRPGPLGGESTTTTATTDDDGDMFSPSDGPTTMSSGTGRSDNKYGDKKMMAESVFSEIMNSKGR